MSLLPVGIGAFDSGYTIDQSLRLRNSAPAMFRRTPSSAGNRRTWTLSWWAKRSKLGNAGFTVFSAGTGTSGDTGELVIKYDNNYPDSLAIQTTNTNIRFTNALYRDPSAWHHVVVAFDTTQTTAANRHKVYVNGEQVTSFNLSNDLAQNTDTAVNNTVQQAWGYFGRINSQYFDGYLTEMYIIDGQQLAASDFGEYDNNGVWKPKAYSGTYGTNGAYLNGTGTTYIEDVSGNNNDFTNVNLQLTNSAVSTYDSMADVPTLNDADTANFCTLNPLAKSSNANLSEGNLNYAGASSTTSGVIGTIAVNSGKWYWEAKMTGGGGASMGIAQLPLASYGPNATGAYIYLLTGDKRLNNSDSSYGASYTTGDIIGVALDMDAGTVTFYKNNTSQGTAFTGLSGNFTAWLQDGSTGSISSWEINFGQRPFAYTPPTGFLKLNTFNLPDSTIEDGSDYFAPVIYTGNGSNQDITTGHSSDFVWLKSRSSGTSHGLYDAVRGTNKVLNSNNTNAEANYGAYGVDAFLSTGFGVTDIASSGYGANESSVSYVAWSWKANGSGVSNTNGDINSTVSANNTSGFSIVSYTGNGTSNSEQTIGHGLSTAPKVVIVKNRTSGTRWHFYSTDLSSDATYAVKNLILNTTSAESAYSSQIRGIQASNTFSVRDVDANGNAMVNKSGDNYIAYCFAEVEGYSSFGKYTGNGSADGPFVYTGFRPAFVVIKKATGSVNANAGWILKDATRDVDNVVSATLQAETSGAEYTSGSEDFLSNGFKIRTNNIGQNTSGDTYIYMAFAENPFKNALAR